MVEKQTKSVFRHTQIFLLTGLILLIGGIYLTQHFLVTIKSGAAYIFIVFLPAPMILFGLYALISGLRQKESSRVNDIPVIATSEKDPNDGGNQDLESNPLKSGGLTEGNLQPENKQLGCGSVMVYSFLIFGMVLMVIIAFSVAFIDFNKGVTNPCLKALSCPDVYLEDSPASFYLAMVEKTAKVLIIPIFIGFFVKKWLDQK